MTFATQPNGGSEASATGDLSQPDLTAPKPNPIEPEKGGANAVNFETGDFNTADQQIVNQARESSLHGGLFEHLWDGDLTDFDGKLETAVEELMYILAIETHSNEVQMERLFRASNLNRLHETQCDLQTGDLLLGPTRLSCWVLNAINRLKESPMPVYTTQAWDEPVPLTDTGYKPPFPVNLLHSWLRQWIEECSVSIQAPPDLFGMLSLAIAGAALARKFEVSVRDGWTEPLNIYTVTALPVGERKSIAVQRATDHLHRLEMGVNAKLQPDIDNNAGQRRLLEKRLKQIENASSKCKDQYERQRLQRDQSELLYELNQMPPLREMQLICDDETPEHLVKLLAEQNGRILQVSAEGTLFEIVHGRYSERSNFDVYLKAHAGDFLITGRITRDCDKIVKPALSVAVAVQPNVLEGLATNKSLDPRGFLARFLYALPTSKLGHRQVDPPPMAKTTQENYDTKMSILWRSGMCDMQYRPEIIRLSPEANDLIKQFENWIEPQLAPNGKSGSMAGWATKLAGACVRLAAIMHCCQQVAGQTPFAPTDSDIDAATVDKAVRLCRDYLLPHAEAAMKLMRANPHQEAAPRVVDLPRPWGKKTITRRDIQRKSGRLFKESDEMNPVLDLLVEYGYLRPSNEILGAPGRGHKSPEYFINPRIPPTDE